MSGEALNWHKSSYSGGTGNDCVEVADNTPGHTMFRDTKLADDSPVITVDDSTWNTFLTFAKQ
ncbi:DUF397 domain-containing protein [Streptomyces sp. NPDC021093]|uniref:DUF397 domain-containing protein n=1 Tax=Streptomyces sp. NPDC021093 TaxID=3365112 RepID=UPI003796974C